jgi:low temperature requirement protein LtrA
MVGRDATATHRSATPLELFFDLTFVVAVAQAAASLHHGLVDGDADSIVAFAFAFFAIWWAWMNFTWFASAYDTDDALYRVMVFVQMTGVLVLAAGIPGAFEDSQYGVMTLGYVVMRFAMVGQWLRAAIFDEPRRRCALRYAFGITVVQIGWIARLQLTGGADVAAFVLLALVELAIPIWAEAGSRTTWHPRHLAERYGLFTIIVLGESILAATVGVQVALDGESGLGDLVTIIVGGLLIVYSMWWIYFSMPREHATEQLRAAFDAGRFGAFGWGYGHYVVFGSIAATGAGLSIAIDQATRHTELSDTQAAATITAPVALFLMAVWLTHRRYKARGSGVYLVPGAALAIVATTAAPEPVLLTGLVLVAVNVMAATDRHHTQ